METLALAARRGDAVAEDRLYAEARNKLVTVALALGVPRDDVADLVQEVLIAAWRNLDRFDPRLGSFLAWLTPGLRGRIHNGFRGSRRRLAFLDRLRIFRAPEPAAETQAAVEAKVTLERLLGSLTARQREVISFYELWGLSSDETARLLGIRAAGVRSIARDARARLRQASRSHVGGGASTRQTIGGDDHDERERRHRATAAIDR